MPLHVSGTFAHHQEVKIALHSLWYHHTYIYIATNILPQRWKWMTTAWRRIRQIWVGINGSSSIKEKYDM